MTIRTLDQHIKGTEGIVGRKPRVAGHRITVENIAIWHDRLGMSVDEIAHEYDLTLADMHAAVAYYSRLKKGQDSFVRSTLRAVPAKEVREKSPDVACSICPAFAQFRTPGR
jgi:uncharacterized protein (DUF433 family)